VTTPSQPLPGAAPHRYAAEWHAWQRGELVRTSIASAVSAAALTIMFVVSLLIVSLAAARPSVLSPTARVGDYPTWQSGPLGPLTSWFTLGPNTLNAVFTAGVSVLIIAYIVVLVCAPRMRPAWALATVVALQLIFFLSPPLPLTDIFNYLNYGRMEMLHHLNPYTTIPALAPHSDPTFVLSNWHGLLSPYGPLFTLITLAVVPLGVAGSFWALKTILLLMSLGSIYLIWQCAKLLGRNPLSATLFFGLNPLVLVWGLGADHNDFLMIFTIILAVYVLLRVRVTRERLAAEHASATAPLDAPEHARWRRLFSWLDGAPRPRPPGDPLLWWEFGAGVALAGAVAIKASAVILIPVILAGAARRTRITAGLIVGLIAAGLATLAAFGPNLPNLTQQDALVIPSGIPNLIGYAIGFGGDAGGVRVGFTILLIATTVACSVWAWRSHDWLAPCAVVTLVLLVTLSWSLPWYIIWVLPFAALARGRWLRTATMILGIYLFLAWMPYASSVERHLGLHPEGTNVGRTEERFLHSVLY
jgi:hypothetical protein